jgi:putative transposase
MPISLAIKQGDIYVRGGRRIAYRMEVVGGRMGFDPVDDAGDAWLPTEDEFVASLKNREVKPYEVVRNAQGEVLYEGDTAFPPRESKKENDARSLFFYGKRWFETGCSMYHKAIKDMVDGDTRGEGLGLKWKPSAGAIHRLVKRFPNLPELSSRYCISQRGNNPREPWHPKIGKALEETVEWYWEESTALRSKNDALTDFTRRFNKVAQELAADPVWLADPKSNAPLKKPSEVTLRDYIDDAECFETYSAKFGPAAADAKFQGNVHPIECSKALQYVLIDSTIADAWCVLDTKTMLPLGRPTITVAIDLFSRMVLAIIITFEPPSLFTCMTALKRINTPKYDINERWPAILNTSDGWGHPECIVVDNELAQSGRSFQGACEDGRMRVRWAPVKRPQYKAVVERFFRTFNDLLLKKLPGGLPYKPDLMRRLGIEPSEVSTITLDVLTELANMAVNDIYHIRPHSTLRMQPALAWQKSIALHKRPFIGDLDFLDKAFGATGVRTLTTSGIQFEGMTFHDTDITSSLLNDLARTTPHKERLDILSSANVEVMFRYNKVNMDAINVWNERRKEYVRLPNAAGDAFTGMSLRHWEILKVWTQIEALARPIRESVVFWSD